MIQLGSHPFHWPYILSVSVSEVTKRLSFLMPRGEGTLERPDKSFRRRNAETPCPWSNDRQWETWKALSSPSLPSCPHCQEQQSKEVVGKKHLCLGPQKLSAWNWTCDLNELLPGLCVSPLGAPPLHEHPNRNGLNYVLTPVMPSAHCAHCLCSLCTALGDAVRMGPPLPTQCVDPRLCKHRQP